MIVMDESTNALDKKKEEFLFPLKRSATDSSSWTTNKADSVTNLNSWREVVDLMHINPDFLSVEEANELRGTRKERLETEGGGNVKYLKRNVGVLLEKERALEVC